MDQHFLDAALPCLDFMADSPTAGHAAANAAELLEEAGYTLLYEQDAWELAPGGKYFLVRGIGTVAAFRIGNKPPEETGFRVAGAHTDVPGFRLKPNHLYQQAGYVQLNTEVYGGPLLASWTDRDLSLAGRLVINGENGREVLLVDLEEPVCRIPQAAIHLNRQVNDKGLKLNKQQHMQPILALIGSEKLDENMLRDMLAEAAGVDPAVVLGYSVEPYDTQLPVIGGAGAEFYFAQGVDNRVGAYTTLKAFIDAPDEHDHTCVAVLFDNEENGSTTPQGAASNLMASLIERMTLNADRPREAYFRALARSIMVSNDGAHAVHPNFADLHDKQHQARLGQGPVIKENANYRYTTLSETKVHFAECAKAAGVPVQFYGHRADLPCGSTIGPELATSLGMDSVDVGIPMLAMHSIRETGGIKDIHYMIEAIKKHFEGI